MFDTFFADFQRVFIDGNGWKLMAKGLGVTLKVSLAAVLIGIVIGFILALMKLTEIKKGKRTVLSTIAGIYIDIIRGTPSVIQLMIMYFLVFRSRYDVVAAMLAFGMNSGAYVAEIVRGGILAVNKGQMEAGRSLGMSYGMTMRHIIIPQAIKTILPALGNEFIVLVKETAVVGYIGIMDLTKAGQFIVSRKYVMFMPYIGVAIVYYIVLKLLSMALNAFERRLRQSDIR